MQEPGAGTFCFRSWGSHGFAQLHSRAAAITFVDYLWQCEGYRPPHRMERVVPDGSMRLIINLQDNVLGRQNPGPSHSFGGCLFAGAHSQFVLLDTRSQEVTMGVHFKPGGASPFLRMPASELEGASVQLETVGGQEA